MRLDLRLLCRILGYSNGEAHRKISACKLASTVAGVKESIAKGELSLSNAASVQVFINQSKKQQKTLASLESRAGEGIETAVMNNPLCAEAIIERVKNKSTRECEVELEKIAAENNIETPEKSVSKRRVGDKTQLKVYLDSDKLQLLKNRLNIDCEQELLQALLDEKLEATEPKQEVLAKPRKQPSLKPRSISPAKRAIVFKKAQNKCENCGSKHFLQVDHKVPAALGGSNSTENLRVLCRSCNQRAAIEQLGLDHMSRYINTSSEYGSSPRRSLSEKSNFFVFSSSRYADASTASSSRLELELFRQAPPVMLYCPTKSLSHNPKIKPA